MADPRQYYPRRSGRARTAPLRLLYAIGIIALMAFPVRLRAQHWEHCGGDLTGNISAIVSADLDVIYALRYTWPSQSLQDEPLYTIYSSRDHGISWMLVRDSVSDECFRCDSAGLFTSVPELSYMRAGTMKENLILQSTNCGASWRQIPGGPSGLLITNGRGVLATTTRDTVSDGRIETGIAVSTNNGATWKRRQSPFGLIHSVAILADSTILLSSYVPSTLGDSATALYRSSDLGVTWTLVREHTLAQQIASSPTDPDEVFAVVSDPTSTSDGGLIRSTDGGKTWTLVHADNATRSVVLPGNGFVIIGDDNSRFRSSDHGNSWQLMPTVGTMLPTENGEIFALLTGFVTRSTDYGLTWHDITAGLDAFDVQCLDRDMAGNIYAGTTAHGIYRLAMSDGAAVHGTESGADQVAPSLGLPWPNPFEENTSITYSLAHGAEIRLGIYDPVGGETRRLADGWMAAGAHQISIDREGLAPGVYFIRLRTEGRTLTRSLTVR